MHGPGLVAFLESGAGHQEYQAVWQLAEQPSPSSVTLRIRSPSRDTRYRCRQPDRSLTQVNSLSPSSHSQSLTASR